MDPAVRPAEMFICFSRCLICGRRTPHELCHRHSLTINGMKFWPSQGPSGNDFNRNQARMWARNFNKPQEVCVDPKCPARDDE